MRKFSPTYAPAFWDIEFASRNHEGVTDHFVVEVNLPGVTTDAQQKAEATVLAQKARAKRLDIPACGDLPLSFYRIDMEGKIGYGKPTGQDKSEYFATLRSHKRGFRSDTDATVCAFCGNEPVDPEDDERMGEACIELRSFGQD